jgi:hypothetical protein
LKHDELFSFFAFKFNLRRYVEGFGKRIKRDVKRLVDQRQEASEARSGNLMKVRRCRLTLSNPR